MIVGNRWFLVLFHREPGIPKGVKESLVPAQLHFVQRFTWTKCMCGMWQRTDERKRSKNELLLKLQSRLRVLCSELSSKNAPVLPLCLQEDVVSILVREKVAVHFCWCTLNYSFLSPFPSSPWKKEGSLYQKEVEPQID